eukprot:scaffold9984_cov148-Skeletonema_dohrnii-CCMP3373.AAC.19
MKIATAAAALFLFFGATPITAKIGGSKASKTSRDGGKSGKANLRSAALSVLLDADAAPIADSFSIARTEAPTAATAALSSLSDSDGAPLAEGFVNVAAMGSSKSGKSESPTSKPSLSPSVSHQPSSAPSLSPSVSAQPSSAPSLSPSVSSQPSSKPSLSPSVSAQPSSKPSLSPSVSAQPSSAPVKGSKSSKASRRY